MIFTTRLIIFVAIFCFMQKTVAAIDSTEYEQRTAALLQSSVVNDRRLAAIRVINLGSEHEPTYDEIAAIVMSSYNEYSVHSKDEVALMLRALSSSQNSKYESVYNTALKSKSKDIRKHAKKALEYPKDEELTNISLLQKQLNLLHSVDTEERFDAAVRFRSSKVDSKEVLTALAEVLVEQAPQLKSYDTDGINALLHITKILSRSLDVEYQNYLFLASQSTSLRKLKAYCNSAYENISKHN